MFSRKHMIIKWATPLKIFHQISAHLTHSCNSFNWFSQFYLPVGFCRGGLKYDGWHWKEAYITLLNSGVIELQKQLAKLPYKLIHPQALSQKSESLEQFLTHCSSSSLRNRLLKPKTPRTHSWTSTVLPNRGISHWALQKGKTHFKSPRKPQVREGSVLLAYMKIHLHLAEAEDLKIH